MMIVFNRVVSISIVVAVFILVAVAGLLIWKFTSGNKELKVASSCSSSIQKRIVDTYKKKIGKPDRVLLIDPAYHENFGDNMIAYAELVLLNTLGVGVDECSVDQSEGRTDPCSDFNQYDVVLWHGGGNWGDLYDELHKKRIETFTKMNKIRVVGMPQSLHYKSDEKAEKDAKKINDIVSKNSLDLHLGWRQKNSLKKAQTLYPKINNFLVPDIAFMIGPVRDTMEYTKKDKHKVDILFLLRRDDESVIQQSFENEVKNKGFTYVNVDWEDAKNYYDSRGEPPTDLMKQVPFEKSVFDFNERFAQAVSMVSTGTVIVTDRLHASILAFLMGKPHIFIDQMYKKIEYTREVALSTSTSCKSSSYDSAKDLKEAISKAKSLLK